MNAFKIVAILLVVGGIFGVAYGGFSYTKETHSVDVGAMHLEMKEKQHVNIPLWLGIASIVGGALLLTTSRRA